MQPNVDVISFTGSTETGRHVAIEAVRMLKRVWLELGGKNAVIVMDDADLALVLFIVGGECRESIVRWTTGGR